MQRCAGHVRRRQTSSPSGMQLPGAREVAMCDARSAPWVAQAGASAVQTLLSGRALNYCARFASEDQTLILTWVLQVKFE